MTLDTESATEVLRDGSRVIVRPIRKQDIELERQFIERLSPESRHFRFLCSMKTPSEALLKTLTDIDTRREAAFIALINEAGGQREVGVARFSVTSDGKAEVAATVSDDWRHKGLGSALMRRLIDVARQHGIDELYSIDASDNEPMRELANYLGFECKTDPQDPTQVIYTLKLHRASTPSAP